MQRITKLLTLLAALCTTAVLAGASAAAAVPSPEAGKVDIVLVGYNANGADVVANGWKEFIDVKNVSTAAVNVDGWFTQDAWADTTYGADAEADHCNTAVFAKATSVGDATRFHYLLADDPDTAGDQPGLWLPKGHTIRVYTGGNVDTSNNATHSIALNKVKCGYNSHYLGNGGDSVVLKDKAGKVVDRFSYSFDNGYWVR
jgi:hypothetical protein